MARMIITHHAALRYQKRVQPDLDVESCLLHLRREAASAVNLDDPTPGGEERWEIRDAILVVAWGFNRNAERRRIVRTVLAKDDAGEGGEGDRLPDWLAREIAAATGGES